MDRSANASPCIDRHNLLGWVRNDFLGGIISDPAAAQLVYVLAKIACFVVATIICARRKYFWKL